MKAEKNKKKPRTYKTTDGDYNAARKYAKKQNVSLAKLVENFVVSLPKTK